MQVTVLVLSPLPALPHQVSQKLTSLYKHITPHELRVTVHKYPLFCKICTTVCIVYICCFFIDCDCGSTATSELITKTTFHLHLLSLIVTVISSSVLVSVLVSVISTAIITSIIVWCVMRPHRDKPPVTTPRGVPGPLLLVGPN